MEKNTKVIKLPAGDISDMKKLDDGTWEVTMNVSPKNQIIEDEKFFTELVLVDVESLSLEDEFLQWEPQNKMQGAVKGHIMSAIAVGTKNFYRPKYDPSYTEDGSIRFVPGAMPAVASNYKWWKKTAKKYAPELHSRIGNWREYNAFLGFLIKRLVEEGKSLEWAWNAVCNDSAELGHYKNSKNSTQCLELTGSRVVCGFYDLANTCKIISDSENPDTFYWAGGCFDYNSKKFPLAAISNFGIYTCYCGVGWIVFS